MNSKNAKDFLPLVQALADGKTIQGTVTPEKGNWMDYDDCENIDFTDPVEHYRIKPEPREFWINWYEGGGYAYVEETDATANRTGGGITIKAREVLDET